MKRLIILSTICTLILSCSSSGNSVETCGDEEFTPKIGLEKNLLSVSGDKSTFLVKTESGGWTIEKVQTTDENGEKEYLNEFFIYDNGKGDFYNKYKDTLSFEWFTVSNPDFHRAAYWDLSVSNELAIELKENNTGIKRTLKVYLMNPLYGDSLLVIQEPK